MYPSNAIFMTQVQFWRLKRKIKKNPTLWKMAKEILKAEEQKEYREKHLLADAREDMREAYAAKMVSHMHLDEDSPL